MRSIALSTIATLLLVSPGTLHASDHNEPQSVNAISSTVASDAGDIYGNFVWPTKDSVVFILTFPAPPFGFEYLESDGRDTALYDETAPNAYDDGVLYSFHIDRDFGDIITTNIVDDELTFHARFGYDANKVSADGTKKGQWGIQVEGIPNAGVMAGPIGQVITGKEGKSGAKVMAGIFDEPFFVDLERFFEGLVVEDENNLAAAKLAFRKDVDFFKGYNVHAIVIEVPKEDIATSVRREVNVWTTSHRLANDPHIRAGNTCTKSK